MVDAREYGHTHLSEVDVLPPINSVIYFCRLLITVFFIILGLICHQIISYADRFENKAILLIHFSARYQLDVSCFVQLKARIFNLYACKPKELFFKIGEIHRPCISEFISLPSFSVQDLSNV